MSKKYSRREFLTQGLWGSAYVGGLGIVGNAIGRGAKKIISVYEDEVKPVVENVGRITDFFNRKDEHNKSKKNSGYDISEFAYNHPEGFGTASGAVLGGLFALKNYFGVGDKRTIANLRDRVGVLEKSLEGMAALQKEKKHTDNLLITISSIGLMGFLSMAFIRYKFTGFIISSPLNLPSQRELIFIILFFAILVVGILRMRKRKIFLNQIQLAIKNIRK
ncbi:MAG TPA: hypothetical protein VJZ93_02405 [Candidatus Nanoarchaeia archaeon]|nr:hypothetical protein [Candidatus Nanoarchaeia archaeon]